jgi:hypothetical protein
MRAFVVAALALLLADCATTTAHVDTPSGRAEATVRASQAAVKSFIQGQMIDAGYSIRTDSGAKLVFGKYGEPSFGIGEEWGYVIGYSLIETAPTVRVVAEPRAVLHFDKLNETEYTMAAEYEQQAMAQADAVLSRLKNKFEVER